MFNSILNKGTDNDILIYNLLAKDITEFALEDFVFIKKILEEKSGTQEEYEEMTTSVVLSLYSLCHGGYDNFDIDTFKKLYNEIFKGNMCIDNNVENIITLLNATTSWNGASYNIIDEVIAKLEDAMSKIDKSTLLLQVCRKRILDFLIRLNDFGKYQSKIKELTKEIVLLGDAYITVVGLSTEFPRN